MSSLTNGMMRGVVFKEDNIWVGMCLEHYIGAQANTLHDLVEGLEVVIEAERQESKKRCGEEFACIKPAPQEYYEMWEKASPFIAELSNVRLALYARDQL